jgi:heme oxygenase
VEQLIEQHIDDTVLPDIHQRRKAHFILHDLSFSKAHIKELPLATQLPQLKNRNTALGALYVLEGSTLGGRGITKLLLKNAQLNLQPGEVQFFNGYGAETGTMWIAFLKILNQYGETDVARTQMAMAANETFTLFKNWLDRP